MLAGEELTILSRIKGSRRSVRANLQLLNRKSRWISVSLKVIDPERRLCVPLEMATKPELEAYLKVREGLDLLATKSDASLMYDGEP